MIKKILQIIILFLNISIFVILSWALARFLWIYFGKSYLEGPPVGGDYFNALTYQIHFSKYLPFPASGWLPFWHEGRPVIGGYPFISFYLTHFLTRFFDVVTAMNFLSAASLILFGIATLALFWQISKNWFLAAAFAAIVVTTQATYYQLTIAGFIVSATSQWYLPTVLFFIWRYGETSKIPYLILSSIFTGLSLLHHPASSLLMIFAPSVLVLFFQLNLEKFSKKIRTLTLFTAISFVIGSAGLYIVFAQQFLGAGADPCASRECWGDYPRHFKTWLTPLSPAIAGYFLVLAVILKIFKRVLNLKEILPALAGLTFFVLYAAAAHFKLINELANPFFPIRFFWAANLFVLIVAASSFLSIKKTLPLHSHLLALISGLIIMSALLAKPTVIQKGVINAVPQDAANYTISNYQTKPLSDLVPEWLIDADKNWRVDIFNSGIYHWWNIVSEIPTVRGYSNNPIGVHQDWAYFLQTATRQTSKDTNLELVRNRVLFLLDAYGIGFFDNGMAGYPESIIEDKNLIINQARLRETNWYQLSPTQVTPIISPTNTQPVLFIGDDAGFINFVRTISMTNLNSKVLIPVKGPKKLGGLSEAELGKFPAIVLYRYSASTGDLEKLVKYIKNGGRVFIETGSTLSDITGKKLPEIFPSQIFKKLNINEENPNFKPGISKISQGVELKNFSPLIFKGGPWNVTIAAKSIKQSVSPVIYYNNYPVVTEEKIGNGLLIWSGLNLPFHIVDNNNYEEAKLFKNIVEALVTKVENQPSFQIKRQTPEKITVEGKGFAGIYFKENHHTGWKAKLDEMNLKVYQAGLDFMYIQIPEKLWNQEIKVSVFFAGNTTTWGLFYLSTISLVLSILYLLIPQAFKFLGLQVVARVLNKKILPRVKNWIRNELG